MAKPRATDRVVIQAKRRKRRRRFDKKNALFHGSLQDFLAGGANLTTEGLRMINQGGANVQELGEGLQARAPELSPPGMDVPRQRSAEIARRVHAQLARSQYLRVSRFADRNRPETLRSPLAQRFEPEGGQWRKRPRSEALLKRAGSHMAGNTDLSPFVSTAQNLQALLQHGDAWVSSIVFGAGDPAKRAPDIGEFQVPKRAIYSPEDAKEQMIKHGQGMDYHRSALETERLYHGDDLDHYLSEWKPNPYTQEDMERFHRGSEEDE